MSTYEERAERRARRRRRKHTARIAAAVLFVVLCVAVVAVILVVTRDRYEKLPENESIAVVTDQAVVYQKDKTDSKKIGRYAFGESLEPVGRYEDWYRIMYDEQEAYVQAADVVLYDKEKKHIALTFDDGPKASTTGRILKALKGNNCRATFFLIGNNIDEETGKLLKKGSAQGCEYGNHTKSHARLSDLSEKKIQKQLAATDKKIRKYTGTAPALCRAPYGDYNKKVLKAMGRPNIMWSLDTRDWDYRDTKRLIKVVKKGAGDGDIVLMHEIYDSTADAVDQICKDLDAAGFEAVTVTELAAIKGHKLEAGKSYESLE